MKNFLLTFLSCTSLLTSSIFAQEKITDPRDGHVYETVKIGEQIWFARNLDIDINDSYCYNHSDGSCSVFGPLYSMIAARNDACPNGWTLPTEDDVLAMLSNVKDFRTEFKPLAGGFRTSGDDFYSQGVNGYFWTSTPVKGGKGKYFYWEEKSNTVKWLVGNEFSAMSVRCLKKEDNSKNVGSFTDTRDKRTYKTVNLAGKTWFAENLAYKTKESICFKNKNANCKTGGRLYNLQDARKACPAGWHLPDSDEFAAVFNTIKMSAKRVDCLFSEDENGNCQEDISKDIPYWSKIASILEKKGFSTKVPGYRNEFYMEGGEEVGDHKGLILWTRLADDLELSNFVEFLPDGTVEIVDEFGPYGCRRSCGSNYYSVRCVKDN